MLRVAFVAPLPSGPRSHREEAGRHTVNLARGIVATDAAAHVDLITVGGTPGISSLQPRLDVRVLGVTAPGTRSHDDLSSSLVDVLDEADIIHVHQAFARQSQLAFLVAKLLGRPVVVTDHGAPRDGVEEDVRYLRLADLFVFQSRFAAGQIPTARPRVTIPGGVDDRFFRPSSSRIERELVLCVGDLLPHTGIDRLLSALPRDIPCVIAGRPSDPAYARYVHALAAGRDVTFVDDVDDFALRDLYRRAWATVVPSVHRDAWGGLYQVPELTGLTVFESMACGTPVIVSSAAALPEFVRHGSTGYVFMDLAELTERTRGLATGEVDVDELGQAARANVEAEYSLLVAGERLWRAYLDVWEQVNQ